MRRLEKTDRGFKFSWLDVVSHGWVEFDTQGKLLDTSIRVLVSVSAPRETETVRPEPPAGYLKVLKHCQACPFFLGTKLNYRIKCDLCGCGCKGLDPLKDSCPRNLWPPIEG